MRAAKSLIVLATISVIACGRSQSAPAPVSTPQAKAVPSTIAEAKMELAAGNRARYEEGLTALVTSADPDTRLQAQILLAKLRREQHRYGEAAVTFQNAANENADLAPYILLRLAEVQVEARDSDAAMRTVREILSRSTSAAVTNNARLLAAQAAILSHDDASVRAALSDLAAVPVDEFTESRFVDVAGALDKGGFSDYAGRLWLRIISDYPQGRWTEKAYQSLSNVTGAVSPLDRLDYPASMKLADRLGRVNRYDQVLDLLGRMAKRFPDQTESPDYRYLRASSLFNSRHYDEVTGIAAPAGQPYSVAIDLLRARALWRTGHNDEFAALTQQIVNSFPGTKQALEGKLLLAKYAMIDAPDYDRASKLLEEAIAEGGAGDNGENLWTLAWLEASTGHDDKALETLDRYLTAYPDADYTSNSLFWSGKVLGHLGRIEERNAMFRKLIDTYPYSYYSYRARQITGDPLPPSSIPGAPAFPDVAAATPEVGRSLELAKRLALIDFVSDAARELKTAVAARPDDIAGSFAIADFYSRSGEPLKAISILQSRFRNVIRHGASAVPDRFWEILFPRPYWDSMVAAATESKVDPLLIPAIIRQESGFDPSIVSNAGAVGIMQIMPAEASIIATRAVLGEAVTREDLFDPAKNIRIGAAEIAQKLESMHGNLFYGIAAYNAGEEAVGRWLAQSPNEDIDFFVESIPYNETRLYVKNVVRNRFEYQRIYGQPSQASPSP